MIKRDNKPIAFRRMAVFKQRDYIMNDARSSLKYQSISPRNKPDRKRQLWLLDNHPFFTGICSNCDYDYGNLKVLDVDAKSSHWNCPNCGLSYEQ